MNHLSQYGVEGPFGIPMRDVQAKALEQLLKERPDLKDTYTRTPVERATSELGDRCDVSWISTEAVDRQKDVVLAKGIDDGQYAKNPVVTLAHNYALPPVGRSLWRKAVIQGQTRGVKAKTFYPSRPDNWTQQDWMPDVAFNLVQSGLMPGKSIGFLPLEATPPTAEERSRAPHWSSCNRVIRKCLLVEYCCHWLPVNQEALVEAVSQKGLYVPAQVLSAFNIDLKAFKQPQTPRIIPLAEVQKAIQSRLQSINTIQLVANAIDLAFAKATGRV